MIHTLLQVIDSINHQLLTQLESTLCFWVLVSLGFDISRGLFQAFVDGFDSDLEAEFDEVDRVIGIGRSTH
uniref:Uncharacterized protein n=1 Tax=Arabidopsis thaliana TaxID=3702 RepID=Q0WRC4_ARATH|nr:hypothetical protein [Arabidopsis thaliana]